jgi:hypothetical protein
MTGRHQAILARVKAEHPNPTWRTLARCYAHLVTCRACIGIVLRGEDR